MTDSTATTLSSSTHAAELKTRLESAITAALDAMYMPGATVSVVHKGEAIVHRGFGVQSLDDTAVPVTDSSLFDIASLTKSFTAACVGVLVHQGKLSWTEPIRTYLPEFETQSEIVTRSATVVDLLAHRLGLVSPDWPWSTGGGRYASSSADLFRMVAHLPVKKPFRASSIYSNYGVALATVLIER
ncbi:beta-lactamase/transpeptidase-like protein, partial [Blastocladiella britannica]